MKETRLPIINLEALLGTDEQRATQLALLRQTAREVGFFYLIGHGLDHCWRFTPKIEPLHNVTCDYGFIRAAS